LSFGNKSCTDINRFGDKLNSNYDNRILIEYPELDVVSSANFNPENSFTNGIPFIAMNFQHKDSNLDVYNTKFGNKSIIPQDIVL
jgi:hypothetical protein